MQLHTRRFWRAESVDDVGFAQCNDKEGRVRAGNGAYGMTFFEVLLPALYVTANKDQCRTTSIKCNYMTVYYYII